jgi:integrase
MPTGKVNKRTIDALRPGPSAAFLWDEDLSGFGVKITPAGALSYVLQYRMGGREAKTQRFTIGGHGSPWTPTTARTEAERLSVLIAQGIDPAEAEKKRRREAVDLAFNVYADSFLKSCKGDGWRALVERSLRIHVKPVLAKKALPLITRADIVMVFDAMPADQQAGRRNAFAILRRLFKWAIWRGDISISPMEGMETPPPVKARDRVLTDDELRRVWLAAPGCHRCFGPIIRLLIVTGQRREEVTGMAWTELDRAKALWRIPGERTKMPNPTACRLADWRSRRSTGWPGGQMARKDWCSRRRPTARSQPIPRESKRSTRCWPRTVANRSPAGDCTTYAAPWRPGSSGWASASR